LVFFFIAEELSPQPGRGIGPILLGSLGGDPENLRGFCCRAIEKIAQLDELGLARRFRRELL
jgi:hypothetical protein